MQFCLYRERYSFYYDVFLDIQGTDFYASGYSLKLLINIFKRLGGRDKYKKEKPNQPTKQKHGILIQ